MPKLPTITHKTPKTLKPSPDPRYPIGVFVPPDTIMPEDLRDAIHTLAQMPELLRESLRHLNMAKIDTPYREGGWTIRQVVHHVADSHSTAFFRVRKALTEDVPTVPGYDEAAFAMLHDYDAPPEWSLNIIEGVHARWVMLLQSLTEAQWQRAFAHAERGPQKLDLATLHYAWHSQHHIAHITNLRAQKGW
jgi:hypothetical protein